MSILRSKSVPASRTANIQSPSADDDVDAFPVLPPDSTGDQRVPTWVQELATARASRQSRASSVVSTRTRFSTTTFDDTRSIDIQAGGQTFRISRFGDRIVETTAPPPYSGPEFDGLFAHQPEVLQTDGRLDDHDHAHHHHRYHHPGWGRGGRRVPRRVRIAMPNQEDTPGANDEDAEAADTPSRVLTDEELHQLVLDLPLQLKKALGIGTDQVLPETGNTAIDSGSRPVTNEFYGLDHPHQSEKTSSTEHRQDESFAGESGMRSILRNTAEVVPDTTITASLDRRGIKRSSFSEENSLNAHREYGHRRESGGRPVDESEGKLSANIPESSTSGRHQNDTSEDLEEMSAPTVGDLNELSKVYNRVIRDLDREHRKQLHDRDKELDRMRILLHEKDIIYRQQLKGKDFVIDDLKARLDRFEAALQIRLERARNEVEDLWETRWKEHQQELMEKAGLIKPALQAYNVAATQTNMEDAPAN